MLRSVRQTENNSLQNYNRIYLHLFIPRPLVRVQPTLIFRPLLSWWIDVKMYMLPVGVEELKLKDAEFGQPFIIIRKQRVSLLHQMQLKKQPMEMISIFSS